MDSSGTTTNTAPHHNRSMSPPAPPTPASSSLPFPLNCTPPPTPSVVILSPCAACKILRRRCVDGCILAPYFPPTEPTKFTTAHRVFGASNIAKILQELPESQRADAVSSMVYEAEARLREPVYGCAGAVCQLQKQANELKMLLARAQADLLYVQAQYANLLELVCVEMAHCHQQPPALSAGGGGSGGVGVAQDGVFWLYDSGQDSAAWEEAELWT